METGIEASGCRELKLIKLFYNQNDDEEEEGREREGETLDCGQSVIVSW